MKHDKTKHDKNFMTESVLTAKFKTLSHSIAKELVNALPPKDFVFETKKHKQKKFEHEIFKQITANKKKISKGAKALISEYMLISKNSPQSEVEVVHEDLNKLLEKKTPLKMEKLLETGTTIQEYYGIRTETLEALYKAAKNLYNKREFEESSQAFFVLALLSSQTAAFWLGYAVSEHLCGRYENALIAYATAAYIDPFDETCHLYAAKCYESQKDIDNAINSLELALIAAKEKESFHAIEKQVHAEIKRLRGGR